VLFVVKLLRKSVLRGNKIHYGIIGQLHQSTEVICGLLCSKRKRNKHIRFLWSKSNEQKPKTWLETYSTQNTMACENETPQLQKSAVNLFGKSNKYRVQIL